MEGKNNTTDYNKRNGTCQICNLSHPSLFFKRSKTFLFGLFSRYCAFRCHLPVKLDWEKITSCFFIFKAVFWQQKAFYSPVTQLEDTDNKKNKTYSRKEVKINGFYCIGKTTSRSH